MRSKLAVGFVLVMAMAVILTGCGSGGAAQITNLSDLGGKVIGGINPSNEKENIEAIISNAIGAKPKEVVYFNSSTDLVAGLIAGKTDAAFFPKFVTEYYAKKNTNLKMIGTNSKSEVGVVMAVRSSDQQLKEDLDNAITTLQANGKLKELEDEWVTNLTVNKEPANKDIQKIEGAKTIYVGVSGDMLPLDYIAADGRPAGFNVALLNEIGKLLKINFEFVSIETQAGFAALSSKKIDVKFIQLKGKSGKYDSNIGNNDWLATKSYFMTNGSAFLVKK